MQKRKEDLERAAREERKRLEQEKAEREHRREERARKKEEERAKKRQEREDHAKKVEERKEALEKAKLEEKQRARERRVRVIVPKVLPGGPLESIPEGEKLTPRPLGTHILRSAEKIHRARGGKGGQRRSKGSAAPLMKNDGEGTYDKKELQWHKLGLLGSSVGKKGVEKVSEKIAEEMAQNTERYQQLLQKIAAQQDHLFKLSPEWEEIVKNFQEKGVSHHVDSLSGAKSFFSDNAQGVSNSLKEALAKNSKKLKRLKFSAEQVIEKTTSKAVAQQTVKLVAKNMAKKAASGAAVSFVTSYGISALGTGYTCCRGKNENFNKTRRKCAERLKGKKGLKKLGAHTKNTLDTTVTLLKESYKEAPPVTQVAKQSAAGSIGSVLGSSLGGMLGGPAGAFLGSIGGAVLGSWLAEKTPSLWTSRKSSKEKK